MSYPSGNLNCTFKKRSVTKIGFVLFDPQRITHWGCVIKWWMRKNHFFFSLSLSRHPSRNQLSETAMLCTYESTITYARCFLQIRSKTKSVRFSLATASPCRRAQACRALPKSPKRNVVPWPFAVMSQEMSKNLPN